MRFEEENLDDALTSATPPQMSHETPTFHRRYHVHLKCHPSQPDPVVKPIYQLESEERRYFGFRT
jgi:hypothetical protein